MESYLPTKSLMVTVSRLSYLPKPAPPVSPFSFSLRMWYVRDANWKLNERGELYDMSKAPFSETIVPIESTNQEAMSARTRLTKILGELDPAAGIKDTGDGTGRHANKKTDKN